MKFNWGTGIAATLIFFVAFMGFMVNRAMQQNYDLVSDDYYAEEIVYQEIIDRKTNALKLEDKAQLKIEGEEVYLNLPSDFEGKSKTFTVHMYYELEAAKDFNFEVENSTENKFAIPFKNFSTGKWIAKVKLSCDGTDYYFDPEIVF